MLNTQAAAILAFLATSTLVSAHGHVASWTVNGEKKAGFNPSNAAQYGKTAERPTINSDQGFADWTSGVVACGGTSAGTGLETWDVNAGSTVTAHWNTWPDSHKGSIAEYMARCPGTSCDGVAADSLDWFKIDEASFNNGKWPTDTVVSSLAWSFKIPADLAPGKYLIRHDLLAMHTTGAPQVYPVCFQANLIGTGTAKPAGLKFPGIYDVSDSFKTWGIYNGDQSAFVPPGPAVYKAGGAAPAPAPAPSTKPAVPSSAPATVAPTTVKPAPSSAAPTTVRPAPSSAAPTTVKPAPSSAAPTTVRPAPSSAPAVPSSAAPVKPTSAPVTPPTTGGSLGGPAPAITKVGDKFVVNGATYNFEGDAKYASCMAQMNKCKNWANGLPNPEVGPAFSLCDSQAATCFSGKKRDVMQRYAKRAHSLI